MDNTHVVVHLVFWETTVPLWLILAHRVLAATVLLADEMELTLDSTVLVQQDIQD